MLDGLTDSYITPRIALSFDYDNLVYIIDYGHISIRVCPTNKWVNVDSLGTRYVQNGQKHVAVHPFDVFESTHKSHITTGNYQSNSNPIYIRYVVFGTDYVAVPFWPFESTHNSRNTLCYT